MKRSYLILGALCATLVVADVTLAITLPRPSTAPVSASEAPAADTFDYSWTDLEPYIAHAGGGILGHTYTNSYEALLLNYHLDHRLFEFDFSLTGDDNTILTHDSTATPTSDNFNSTLIQDKFRPLSLDQLIKFLYSHPDAYIITDTKATDEPTTRLLLEQIRSAATDLDLSILDRFIIQIYHPDMLAWAMDIHPWKSIIYTLYQDPDWTPESVLAFAEKTGVKYITLFDTIATPETLKLWQAAGLLIGVHTINDLTSAQHFLDLGATNIYTDYLTPRAHPSSVL